jgi:Ser/Thr protein kinase RdoA (MazF antagonist)
MGDAVTTPILRARPSSLPRPDRLIRRALFRRRPPALDVALLDEILAQWGLRLEGAPQAADGAGRSDSAILSTSGGRKVLKRYKGTLDVEAVRHEHGILSELARLHFPAPRLTSTLSGETLLRWGGHSYALFEFLEGGFQYHNYLLLPGQRRRLIASSGRALAVLHATLRDFEPPGRHPSGFRSRTDGRWRDMDWYASQLAEAHTLAPGLSGDAGKTVRRALAGGAGPVERRLQQLHRQLKDAGLPRLVVHGDYGPYNLLFRPGAPVVILDFELARLDWRLTDLATALPSFGRTRLGFSRDDIASFLAAYAGASDIGGDELRLLPDVWRFLSLRRALVAWRRACDGDARRWLDEAAARLALVRWLDVEQKRLDRLLADVARSANPADGE